MENKAEIDSKEKCSVGGCGSPGLCPGTALMIAFLVGTGLVELTGIKWLLPVVTIVLGGLLISGVWKRLMPKKQS